MAKLQVLRGLKINLPETSIDGAIYFTTDTNELFIGYNNEYRKVNSFDNIEEYQTTAQTFTIQPTDWIEDDSEYKTIVTWDGKLLCGKDGNVPPLISCINNTDEYSNIVHAEANPGVNGTIEFYINERPQNDISIVIIDNK